VARSTTEGRRPTSQLYFRDLRRHKLLDRDQERALAQQFRLRNDQEALSKLIKGNLRLVVKIAKGFWIGNGTSFRDIVQEGNVGLVKAARKYDPMKKTKFSHYAGYWIKAYIYKHLMNNYRSVRIGKTQSQRKLYYNLKKIKARLIQEGVEPTPGEISRRLKVPQKDVFELQQHLEHPEISLNAPVRGRNGSEKIDMLAASSSSVEEKYETQQLRKLVRENSRQFKKQLNRREKEIFDRRILSSRPETLKTLGDKYGVSRERIRQVESRIIERLRDHLVKEFPDIGMYLFER
jgi:RNA polymerase sigma-32 factor